MDTLTLSQDYLINAINSENYNIETNTIKEKLQFFYDTFISAYGYNLKTMSKTKAIAEYFSGLPSCINIDYTNNDILDIAKKWHIELETEEREDTFILRWFYDLASDMRFLLDINGIK